MRGGFIRGLFIGTMVGATVSMMNSNSNYKMRRKLMKQGNGFIRKASNVLNSLSDVLS